jgi:hypothetical protein
MDSILKDKKSFLSFISGQAITNGNAVCVDHYYNNGMSEYAYPKQFTVFGDKYYWSMSSWHTKGKSMSVHWELWFHGRAFPGRNERISTGELTKGKLFAGFEKIRQFYIVERGTAADGQGKIN